MGLNERSVDILGLADRVGYVTIDAAHAAHFEGKGREAAHSKLKRLRRAGYLDTFRLPNRYTGFRLTPRGARAIGSGRKRFDTPGPQKSYEAWALLEFLSDRSVCKRTLVAPAQIRRYLDITTDRLPRPHFYHATHGEQAWLGFVVIDYGADARRTLRKSADFLARILRNRWVDHLIVDGLFELAVVTHSPSAKRRIDRKLPGYLEEQLGVVTRQLPLGHDRGFPVRLTTVSYTTLRSLLPEGGNRP